MSHSSYGPVASELPVTREKAFGTGWLGWIATVDHKRIGIMYLLVSLVFFGAGGIEALLMRLQLIRPNNDFLSPDAFNQIFTMHGTTMIFLVAMPVLTGMANYLVPVVLPTKSGHLSSVRSGPPKQEATWAGNHA